MVIIFVVPTLKNIGPTRQLKMLIQGLAEANHKIHIVTFPREESENELKEYFNQINVNIISFKRTKLSLLKNVLQLKKLVQQLKSDIVHSHLFYADLITSLAVKRSNSICTLRSVPSEELRFIYGSLKGYVISLIHLWAVKRFTVKIACSKTVRRYYRSRNVQANVIYNALPASLEKFYKYRRDINCRVEAKKKFNLPQNALVAIMVGSLDKRKNPFLAVELIKAVTRYCPNVYFFVVGDGPLRQECYSVTVGYPQIRIEGFVFDVSPYYQAADIFLSSFRK